MKPLPVSRGLTHVIKRTNIFQEMCALFKQMNILNEFPFRVRFAGEQAVDTGGVSRDMFSSFWDEAFQQFFDGQTLMVPVVTDMSALPLLGTIISHGYLVSGFLPVRIAFPVLAGILLGANVDIPDHVLLDTWNEYLCTYEAALIKDALVINSPCFPKSMQHSLIGVLSRCGCREIPTPQTLRRILTQVASYEFHVKPVAAITTMSVGVPSMEQSFWMQKSVADLYKM